MGPSLPVVLGYRGGLRYSVGGVGSFLFVPPVGNQGGAVRPPGV